MEQFEKVCKGLECCEPYLWHCYQKQCPYYKDNGCLDAQRADALALIRQQQKRIAELEAAQTARIVKPEDFENNPDLDDNGHLNVWQEYKDGSRCGWDTINVNEASTFRDLKRYWTHRPTDAQREAEKWE